MSSGVGEPRFQGPVKSDIIPSRLRPRARTARFLVMLVTVIIVGNALVGERGLLALILSNQRLASVSDLIDALRADNDSLRQEVRMLREEPRRIEELARQELGLIEPGEKLFIVPSSHGRSTTSQD